MANKLNNDQVSLIKGMLARGDQQMDIATWFNTNVGRISEINTGFRPAWREIEAARTGLPPPGPYKLVEREAVVVSQAEYSLIHELMGDLAHIQQKYDDLINGRTQIFEASHDAKLN